MTHAMLAQLPVAEAKAMLEDIDDLGVRLREFLRKTGTFSPTLIEMLNEPSDAATREALLEWIADYLTIRSAYRVMGMGRFAKKASPGSLAALIQDRTYPDTAPCVHCREFAVLFRKSPPHVRAVLAVLPEGAAPCATEA